MIRPLAVLVAKLVIHLRVEKLAQPVVTNLAAVVTLTLVVHLDLKPAEVLVTADKRLAEVPESLQLAAVLVLVVNLLQVAMLVTAENLLQVVHLAQVDPLGLLAVLEIRQWVEPLAQADLLVPVAAPVTVAKQLAEPVVTLAPVETPVELEASLRIPAWNLLPARTSSMMAL